MPFPIEDKLVVAVSSSAVFDMTAADQIFRTEGVGPYRAHQLERLDDPFEKGVAFPFIKRLLRLNEVFPDLQPIEVIVLSRNDPDSGRRFFRCCRSYGLTISRGAFLNGKSPYPYISAFNASLFLSATEADVRNAIDAKLPAGLVLPTLVTDEDTDSELRVAFDFDGVIIDDEAEAVFQETKDLNRFHKSETSKILFLTILAL
jgi:5'-nucleotidase